MLFELESPVRGRACGVVTRAHSAMAAECAREHLYMLPHCTRVDQEAIRRIARDMQRWKALLMSRHVGPGRYRTLHEYYFSSPAPSAEMPDAVAVHTENPAVLATHPCRQVPAWWHRLELPSQWCGIQTLLTLRSTCRALRELVGQQPIYEACRERRGVRPSSDGRSNCTH
eukprot:s3447_g6.t1